MLPDERAREVALQWLGRARSNLALAKQPKPAEALWEDLCFDAEQAAEKIIKAVLVRHQIDFPKTHRVAELLALASGAGDIVPEDLWQADRLSDYAILTRYPGNPHPVDEAEYRSAVVLAEQVVRWAEEMIRARD